MKSSNEQKKLHKHKTNIYVNLCALGQMHLRIR